MSRRAWLLLLTVPAAIDAYAAFVRHDGTVCHEVFRRTFATHSRPGQLRFVAAYAAFTAWFLPHVLRWPTDKQHPPEETP